MFLSVSVLQPCSVAAIMACGARVGYGALAALSFASW